MKLFLKGDRCFTEKCAIEKRNYAPGQHGKGGRIKSKLQGYGLQLREKQKVKRLYRMQEGQFALTFDRAAQEKGVVGEVLLGKLERRLDNVVYRLGFATSRAEARQLVRHGHFTVNGRKASIPSMLLRAGDVVVLREGSREVLRITAALEALEGKSVPGWLDIDKTNFAGSVKALPVREDITMPIQEQLIVELYSR
jgi:small subunit ribosomal protein S4